MTTLPVLTRACRHAAASVGPALVGAAVSISVSAWASPATATVADAAASAADVFTSRPRSSTPVASAPQSRPTAPATPVAPDPAPGPAPDPQAPPPGTSGRPGPAARKASGPPPVHFAVFFEGGYQGFIATETFDATLGKTGGGVLGGGGSLTHRSGIFVQVDVTRFKAEGERAFVYGSQVFRLGIPLNLEVRPIEVSGGYKFFMRPPKPKAPVPPPKPLFEPARPTRGEQAGATGTTPVSEAPASRRPSPTPRPRWGGLKPYVGGGMGVVRYRETSSFASSGENVDDSFTSVHLLGGIEVPLWKWVGTAVEVNYRWVQDALGEGGLSSEFGEDDLGGPSFRVKISVGR